MFGMAIHPTGAVSLSLAAPAHTLALLGVLLLFLGACGLTRRIAARDRLAFAAIVIYAFACVAVLNAGAVSGFILPPILQHMAHDTPAAAPQWRIVVGSIFQFNQAFSRIFSVAGSLAIFLWSVSALRNGGFARAVAIYGCIVAPLIIIGIAIGHLRLNVHGMAAIGLAQVIWFVLVGAQMCSRPPATTTSSDPTDR